MARRLLAALLAGGASVFAFAPFDLFPLAFLGLGALAWLLGGVARWREGFALGFAWGFGAFIAGVSWRYVALERYGGMPAPLVRLDGVTLLQRFFFRLGEHPLLGIGKAALFAALPIAPPKRCRAVQMSDICAVLLVRLGLRGATVQFAIRYDFRRYQSFAVQNVPKCVQGFTHCPPPGCRGFQ